ncbi:MAG: sugar ABC transporter ATP-binding protein [Phycisphaerae bacterium]|nr:sugar ABC transporter ATP-binding protein [Phycisphaerae bacterium]
MTHTTRLETISLRKEYPGTVALDAVSVSFTVGRVTALIGKNGAGKSTLIKILSGAIRPTCGELRLDGRALELRSPRDALARGIGTVHQELSLVPSLSVAENILLNRLPLRRGLMSAVVDWRSAYAIAESVLADLGVSLDVQSRAGSLSVAQQQIVEIARVVSFRPRVVMFDEPTSALARTEVERLFEAIRNLAARGVIVIYITHRLHELSRVADEVTALRDGKLVGTIPIREASTPTVVRMMFGDAAPTPHRPSAVEPGPPVLEVRDLSYRDKLNGVSFSVGRGEIVGIGGMLGSGRSELLHSIFGSLRYDRGEVLVNGESVCRATPAGMKRLGVALTPESRKTQSIVPRMSIRDNACLAALRRISSWGFIRGSKQRRMVEFNVRELQIAVSSVDRPITSLSGGNQQKVVIGNWLNTEPSVMLFDEPTRGIDVQAKGQIFDILRSLSSRGIACVFVSSELEELLEVCHRIVVLHGGKAKASLDTSGLTVDRLFAACMGEG